MLLAACQPARPPAPTVRGQRPPACALIVTDDDIPSGSATAGALYVKEAELGRRLLTADVKAVARGFLDGGLPCVQVIDSHDGAIDPGPLKEMGVPVLTPSGVKRWTWPFIGPMEVKAAMVALVGFHSPAGATGFRCHTINDSIRRLRINGRAAGEVAHMILGLGGLGVPVVLVSGDMNATAEAASLVPGVEQVTVRWLGPQGETRFLGSAEAAARLRDAARRAVSRRSRAHRPRLPLRIELETHSVRAMKERSRTLDRVLQEHLKDPAVSPLRRALGRFTFGSTMRVSGRRLTWSAADALTAFLTITLAASHLRGTYTWEKVSEGYAAYEAGRYDEAMASYQQAMEQNPYDLATRCRIAAVHQKLGRTEQARQLFALSVKHLDEVGSAPMRIWCLLGLARTALQARAFAEAEQAARRLISAPDLRQGHAEAQDLLHEAKQCTAAQASDDPGARRACELAFITRKIEEVYSYLEVKQQRYGFSFAKLRAETRSRVEQALDEKEYRRALDDFLGRFHDGHLRLKDKDRPARPRRLPPAVTHRWLPGRILVTRIARLWGDAEPIRKELDRVLELSGRARAMVVDLRGNRGGDDALAFDFISRLLPKEIPLGRVSVRISGDLLQQRPYYVKLCSPDPKRPGFSVWRTMSVQPRTRTGFAGPIAVLIDRACYSSCEGTALAFKESGMARLYGQRTGGGSANPIHLQLPLSGASLMVPTWIQVMPDGNLLEDNGVAPDVELAAKKDPLRAALRDIRGKLRDQAKDDR